jgi:hypothetical protein
LAALIPSEGFFAHMAPLSDIFLAILQLIYRLHLVFLIIIPRLDIIGLRKGGACCKRKENKEEEGLHDANVFNLVIV